MKSTKDYKVNQTVSKTPLGVKKMPPKPVIPQVPVPPPVVQQVAPQPQIAPVPKPIQAPVPVQSIAPQKEMVAPQAGPDATSTQLIDLTNAYRQAQKLTPYQFNPILSQSAQKRAEYLAEKMSKVKNDQWTHQGTDNQTIYDNWLQTIRAYGYEGSPNKQGLPRVGENLAEGWDSAERAMREWQKSPTHNANLINQNFRDIGIGYATYTDPKTGKEKVIFVQHFGVPKQ